MDRAASVATTLAPGDVLDGRYRVDREIGSGAMGLVFAAQHLALGRPVVVKVLRPELTGDPELVGRFEQEARAASAIGHPAIVHVFDLGVTPAGARYMVMELLEGRSLATVLEQEGAMAPARAVAVVGEVLDGLAAAHRHGIVHRDLKPENVFIVERAEQPAIVKLLDFGISKVLGTGTAGAAGTARVRATTVGMILGTPAYMSPEQARGDTDRIDARTDLYAAGVMLYELLAGQPPFDGENIYVTLAAVLAGTYVPLATACPGLPPAVVAVVERAMAVAPDARYRDAAAMREAIRQAQAAPALADLPALELPDLPRPAAVTAWMMPSSLALEAVPLDAGAATVPPPSAPVAAPAERPPQLDAAAFRPPPVTEQALDLAVVRRSAPAPREFSSAPARSAARTSIPRGLVLITVLIVLGGAAYLLVGPAGVERAIALVRGWIK